MSRRFRVKQLSTSPSPYLTESGGEIVWTKRIQAKSFDTRAKAIAFQRKVLDQYPTCSLLIEEYARWSSESADGTAGASESGTVAASAGSFF